MFKQWLCAIDKRTYANGRVALQLIDAEDGCPIATATVNLPDEQVAPDETFIKDYSENAGMLEALLKAGIIERTGVTARTGFVTVEKVKVLV